ncbi:type II secretion system protein N [Sphingomicrobium flavum]|uniref:type II secretion system protein N n=1 Tax=Sphingomicrobium flavum TaxID=1229164 RepID=UPI0021AD5548|nr:type II secretion system protein N [Sphingomicrobium flavum]
MQRPWWRDRLGAAQLHLLARAVLLAMLALLLARLIWTAVTPIGPVGDWRPPAPRLLSAAERSNVLATANPFGGTTTVIDSNAVTSLDIELFGVTVNQASGGGSAIVGLPDGTQQSIGVGEEILPGASLAEVTFTHIVIDRGGIRERLYLDESMPAEDAAREVSGPGTLIPEGTDPSQAFNITPRMRGNEVTGIRLTPGTNRALFEATGLSPGDIVVEINGISVTSSTDIDMLRRELRPGARLTLTVERGSNRLPIALTF